MLLALDFLHVKTAHLVLGIPTFTDSLKLELRALEHTAAEVGVLLARLHEFGQVDALKQPFMLGRERKAIIDDEGSAMKNSRKDDFSGVI